MGALTHGAYIYIYSEKINLIINLLIFIGASENIALLLSFTNASVLFAKQAL